MIKTYNLDADTTAFFSRQLEHVYAQTYDIKYATLKAREFVPVSNAANPGATTVTYRQFDRVGQAKIIADNAKDIPRAEVNGVEFTRPVRTVGAMYAFTVMEIRAAAMAGSDLNARKAASVRRMVEEKLDDIAALGDADHGIPTGFLNDAAVPTQTVPTGVGGVTFALKTPDEIILDFSAAFQRIVAATEDVESPDTVVLPPAQFALLHTTRLTDTGETIASFLRGAFGVTLASWNKLTGAGAGATDRFVMYRRSSDILTQEIPSEFEQMPVQEMGLEFQINTMARTAGTAIYYPLALDYSDGI